jgi:hypothetical protein
MSSTDISWRVKAAGTYGWQTYDFQVPVVLKSVSLTLLKPSGLVQACTGIAYVLLSTVVFKVTNN